MQHLFCCFFIFFILFFFAVVKSVYMELIDFFCIDEI